MSVALVGAAAIGVAGTIYASNQAGKAAKKAGKKAGDADAERMAFAREQYDEWQATYGPVEDQLAAYYETLSPTLRTVQGLEAFEKEKNRALTNLNENLAQRGIATSGIAAQQNTEVAINSAGERARIRAAAPMEVAKEKLSFLQVGLGQNPNSGVTNALSTQQTNANNIANTTARNAGNASGAVASSVADLAGAGLNWWTNKDRDPAPANPSVGG